MNTLQKTIIVLLCGILGMSVCRSQPEQSRSVVAIRFGENEPTTASPIAPESVSTEVVAPESSDNQFPDVKPVETGDLSQSTPQAQPPYPQPAVLSGHWEVRSNGAILPRNRTLTNMWVSDQPQTYQSRGGSCTGPNCGGRR